MSAHRHLQQVVVRNRHTEVVAHRQADIATATLRIVVAIVVAALRIVEARQATPLSVAEVLAEARHTEEARLTEVAHRTAVAEIRVADSVSI